MGLINRYGTQPQPVSTQTRGGGGVNRGMNRGPNRGGGGGGGGNNRTRIPNTGLYHGRAGKGAANQNPESFFRSAVSRVGGLDYAGTPVSQFSEDFAAKLMEDYLAAQAGNQRLAPTKYLKTTYGGAGYDGKKGRSFDPGTLGLGGGAMDEAYTDWYSNQMPSDYLVGRSTNQGGFAPGGGNEDFQRWQQESYVPSVLAETAGARESNPRLSVADLMEGRDIAGESRRQYLARPNAARQFSPANLGGRWAWWE
ncbi:MAG: hypothetical protein H0W36_07640 [Gemmatimonadetes bacterium]|nr:hypothetical protein [Gemmatimonadota bacterium]